MFGGQANTASAPFLFDSSTQNTNTGFGSTANSGGLFGNQQKKTNTGLFGSSTTQAPASSSTGLFGGQQTSSTTANTSGGLFGLKPATTTGFGATASTSAPSTPFGAKPAAPATGGLFGSLSNTVTTGQFGAANTNTTAAPATGGLFGSSTTQPTQLGGLFGSLTANTAKPGGLFGLAAPVTNTITLGGSTGGLFGSNNAAKPAGLFGLLNTQSNTTNGSFGGSGTTGTTGTTGGLFGGQQQAQAQQQQPQTQLTAMTRVGDLPPDVKKELQDFDKYINTQHLIATTLNDDMAKHDQLIKSIPSDVDYLHTKILSIRLALKFDTDQLKLLKTVNDELTEDIGNIMQLIVQLSTPGTRLSSSYHLNEFFAKRIKKYKELLSIYEGVITEGDEAITGLEKSCNETFGNISDVIEVVKNQYVLFMELCESLAQIHGEVTRLTN